MNAYQRRANVEAYLERDRMTQKADISKSWSSVTSVLDDRYTNE